MRALDVTAERASLQMDLLVDDFGCVPDGRFLERVSIDAGSAVLTVPDGDLRAIDVGKNVAVPGAVDLVATVARLLDRRHVANATMTAGSARLTGTLFDPDNGPSQAFRTDLHVGLRITVAGAGPGGSTLVSDVAAVINGTTIDLAHAASASVTNVEVILNRPDRVALSNYARRSVSSLTVDLHDRIVSDAAMTIGGRGLASATAKFSSLDLGKEVTIRDAGLFVTTIASFQSSTQVTLSTPAQRAVADVSADVWKTDSRPGLESLLADLDNQDIESGEIRFGPGVYDFSRIPPGPSPMNAAIGLRRLKNLTFRGSGQGATILRLMPNQDLSGPDTHLVETRDCSKLTLRDCSLHGAYLTMGNTNEQMHGINLNEGSVDISVERVRVFQTAGDGIRLLGRPTNKVRQVRVDNCRFVQNKRTGVSFQRACEFVWVRNCYIEMTAPSTDACLDFEPTGNAAPSDVIIDSNVMVHGTRATAVSLSGISGPDPSRRIQFTNNILLGGNIFCTDVDQLTVQGNAVVVPDDPLASRAPFVIQRGGDSVRITGNLFVCDDASTEAVISLSEVNGRRVSRAIVSGNLCVARTGIGIRVTSNTDVAVEANMIVATGTCTHGISVSSGPGEIDGVSVRDNDVTVEGEGSWAAGIRIAAAGTDPVRHVSVVANSIRGATEGVRFQGSNFEQVPVCALNRMASSVARPLVGVAQLPQKAVLTGGAASRGGTGPGSGAGRILAGIGDPNQNNVIGNAGDLFQRIDDAPGPRLFVKESDTSPGQGWSPK